MRWIANLSVLFTELPLLARPAAATAAGFDAAECWWPFGRNDPSEAEVDAFVGAVRASGIELYAMNLWGGDPAAGERGVLSAPDRAGDFRASVEVARLVAAELGTRFFNAPYGRLRPDLSPARQDEAATAALGHAARTLAPLGGTVLVEPLSGAGDYPLRTVCDALAVIARVAAQEGVGNLGLLVDQYHLMTNGEDVLAVVREHAARIAHVQVADLPTRGEPGSGTGLAAIRALVAALEESDYAGVLALEYLPTTSTERSLEVWRAALGLTGPGGPTPTSPSRSPLSMS